MWAKMECERERLALFHVSLSTHKQGKSRRRFFRLFICAHPKNNIIFVCVLLQEKKETELYSYRKHQQKKKNKFFGHFPA